MIKQLPPIALALGFATSLGAFATWFENSDQQALRQFEAGDYIEAAYGFSDPYRKGVALYRAGRYADAAKNFEVTEDPENRIEARYNLGNTRFQLADFAGAVTAFEQVLSADPTHSDAQHNLGVMYKNGQGVAQDHVQAVHSYRKAAEQGYANAQFNLGGMYRTGQGVTQDYKEAMKWYRKAAEQGHAEAQFNLGCAYNKGEGVEQDHVEAVKWYRRAAEQGVVHSDSDEASDDDDGGAIEYVLLLNGPTISDQSEYRPIWGELVTALDSFPAVASPAVLGPR